MFKKYYLLIKPGIVYGNALSAAAGFLLASKGRINIELFFVMMIGISLVIASACVFNNYLDRSIDAKMQRTKNRALVKGIIPTRNALIYASALGLLGILILALRVNFLTVGLSLTGLFFYVVMYSIWKRHSIHGTIVGSISGSIPLVVGYCAVTNRFDTGAILLFIILMLWQMPHFYALAMYRVDEYALAKLPVLPAVKGMQITKKQIIFYIIAFIIAVSMLALFKIAGYIYLIITLVVSLLWLIMAVRGLRPSTNDKTYGRLMFRTSLIVLLIFYLMISINIYL